MHTKRSKVGLKLDTILRKQHIKNLENWNFKPGKPGKNLESAMKMWVAGHPVKGGQYGAHP